MEIYLNIAEWGPGIYGIEAAAQHHFGKSAKSLTAPAGGAAGRDAAQSDRSRSRQARTRPEATGRRSSRSAPRKRRQLCALPRIACSAEQKNRPRRWPNAGRACIGTPTFQTMVRSARPLARGFAGLLTDLVEQSNGRTETKNLSVQARHAPFGRCAEGSDLCRGQELRRNAPPAPHRPEDRHVSRPPGSGAEGKLISSPTEFRRIEGPASRRSFSLPRLTAALDAAGFVTAKRVGATGRQDDARQHSAAHHSLHSLQYRS